MIKKVRYLLFMMFLFIVASNDVYAGTLSIWASASNVMVGQDVTISVKVDHLAGKFNITSSNQAILSGGSSGSWLENDTYTFQFTAKSVGKATVTATAIEDVGDFDTNGVFSGSKSVTLNVIEKQGTSSSGNQSNKGNTSGGTTAEKKEYSGDNYLSSLAVDGYMISPEFQKDTTEYKLTVDESVEKITIQAKASHEKASVTGTGEINLSSGENTIEVKVTAENGNEKVYKIIVTVEDQNPLSVMLHKKKYTLVKRNNQLIEPLEFYEEETILIDEQEVVAYTNKVTKVTLVLLKDEENKIGYYVYNKKSGEYTEYHSLSVHGVTLQLLNSNGVRKGYTKYQEKIQNQTVDIYKLKKGHKVGLIYGTNVQTGNTSYYVYDANEQTLSKYYEEEVFYYQNELHKMKNHMMIFIGIVSFFIIILVIISLVRGKRRKKITKWK